MIILIGFKKLEEKIMKKAGDYFDEACDKHEADQKSLKKDLNDEPYFVEAIRKAQQDAIDEAVKTCAESAKLLFHDGHFKLDKRIEHFQSGVDNITVSKQSILEVANKLKEEL